MDQENEQIVTSEKLEPVFLLFLKNNLSVKVYSQTEEINSWITYFGDELKPIKGPLYEWTVILSVKNHKYTIGRMKHDKTRNSLSISAVHFWNYRLIKLYKEDHPDEVQCDVFVV